MRLELFIIFLYFISVNATHLHEIVQVEKNEKLPRRNNYIQLNAERAIRDI